jgi:RND family efflux transporter MFP subunit
MNMPPIPNQDNSIKRCFQIMRTPALLFLATGLALPVAIGITGCKSKKSASEARAAEIPSAKVAAAGRGNIAHTLSLAGQFQPYQVVDVHPKVTGFMVKINVDIGDRVRKGQTLAILEVPELKAQLRGTVFEMQQAKDDLLRTQHEIKRAEAIHSALHADYERLLETSKAQPGLVAQQELDDAQSKDLSSESQVDAAKAAAAAAQQHTEVAHTDNDRVQAIQNYTNVVAPLDGVIVWRYADTGALIQSGTNSNEQDIPIVKLSQSGLLRLRMPIPENDVQYVHIGDPMQIRVDAIGRSFTGKIVRFTRDVNFETRTMETEVDVENQDLSIAPGMYANTQLQLAHAENVVTVPADSLVIAGNTQTVYVLDGSNHVHIREVEVGIRGSKLAEIKSGLALGDRVIVGGQEQYTEGEEVSPILLREPTSDVMHESGGVIDLKADENNGGTK